MTSFLIDYNMHGKWYNKWLDTAAEFKRDYVDHNRLHTVATVIVNLIEAGLKRDPSDPMHSFNRYGAYEKDYDANMATLAQDVMADIQEPHLRQYVVSFFHSGGANHEELADLFDEFTEFCDHAVIRDETDDESATDSESETDSEGEAGEPAVQWSWGPTYTHGPNDPNTPPVSYDPNIQF